MLRAQHRDQVAERQNEQAKMLLTIRLLMCDGAMAPVSGSDVA